MNTELGSFLDIVVSGGPLMIPIALCSVIALAYMIERSLRMSGRRLGTRGFGDQLVQTVRDGGAVAGLELCRAAATAQARILAAGLLHSSADWQRREKAVEDAGAREIDRLSANLRPLVVISMIAPLLGLLGTVWGMIDAFANIALADGLGNPEMLAAGISQAHVTTAAGLAVAIPTHAAYYWFRSRVDRFAHATEDLYGRVSDLLSRSQAEAVPEPVA
jgi:biopolymer transport protein ExbB